MKEFPQIAIAGLSSAIALRPEDDAAPCMAQSRRGGTVLAPIPARYFVGPGGALVGAILAKLGLLAAVEADLGDDPPGKGIRPVLESAAPKLRLTDHTVSGGGTPLFRLNAHADPLPRLDPHSVEPGFHLHDLPLGTLASHSLGIWCHPASILSEGDASEALFLGLLETNASRGVTQMLAIGRPLSRRTGGTSWQDWLRPVLSYTDILCGQADDLLELLDASAAHDLEARGELHDLPAWLTGRVLHDLSGYLLSCGLGVAVIGLREHGVYLRTNPDADRVAFARKFAPDDQTAAHLATWTERDMLIPLFETAVGNSYALTDALVAGIASSVVTGKSPGDAMRIGAAVVSLSRETENPLDAIPQLDVVEARIEGGWRQSRCLLDLRGWSDE